MTSELDFSFFAVCLIEWFIHFQVISGRGGKFRDFDFYLENYAPDNFAAVELKNKFENSVSGNRKVKWRVNTYL